MTRGQAAVAAIGITLAAGTAVLARGAAMQSGYDLEIVFDGGYIYHFNARDFVEVKTLAKGKHPMRVRIESGTVTEGGLSEFRLANGQLELWPDGAAPAPAKPDIPPSNEGQTGCKPSDKENPNNRLFIPDLGFVAKEMGTKLTRGKNPEKPDKAGSILLTGGGALSITSLGGCVEFRKPDNTPLGAKRSMANGIGGIRYNWAVPRATTLTLRIIDTRNSAKSFDLKVQPDGRIIRLRVSSFDRPQPAVKGEIQHFRTSFDDAFEIVNSAKRVTLHWLGEYEDSPGIDCPSGGDPDPWPEPDPSPAPNPPAVANR